ncbi:hypothetical protein M405DRAFT_809330 [Rhizopogon salebrosus TDB-379]|nr:hypothetical protein M405DRAFT_809330 [Rhizopogon salebrosus TDB-379]
MQNQSKTQIRLVTLGSLISKFWDVPHNVPFEAKWGGYALNIAGFTRFARGTHYSLMVA